MKTATTNRLRPRRPERLPAQSKRKRLRGCRAHAAWLRYSAVASNPIAVFPQRQQNVASTGVHHPGADLIHRQAGARQNSLQNLLGTHSGERRHFAGQDVAQHAVALLKLQCVSVFGQGQ